MNLGRIFILLSAVFVVQAVVFAGSDAEQVYKLTKTIAAESKDNIWPGFDPLIYTVLKDNALHFSPEPDNPTGMIFMKLSSDYFASYTLEQNLAITVHEAFHGFERSPARPGREWGYENAMLVFEYEGNSARNNALFAIEAKFLKEAMFARDDDAVRRHVRNFLLVRHQRQNEIDPRFVEFEKGAELNEGLAEYAGTKAVLEGFRTGAARKSGLSFEAKDAAEYLSKKYAVLDAINSIGSNIRRKFYYVGSAQAFLLERLKPGTWKTRVQMDGANLQALLFEAVSPLDELLRSSNYENVLLKEENAVAERVSENKQLLRSTLSREGTKLRIDYSGIGGSNHIRNFDPMNVTMIDSNLRIHTRFVTFARENVFTAQFNEPVVEDLKQKEYVAIVSGNVSVVADGVQIALGKDTEMSFEKRLKIAAENVEIEASRGSLVIGNGGIKVTLTTDERNP